MIGTTLGRFRVTARLGEGGMGEVFRARDERLDRDVAIKVLAADVAQDPDRVARFEREARTLAALDHPNVATVFGLEQAEERSFLVMELIEGETLAARLERGPLPWPDLLAIGIQVSDGLAAAHAAGIVHRDLKPANVMVTPEGRVKLLDFGIARSMVSRAPAGTAAATLTAVGTMVGTLAYMSPEQALGRPLDARSDLFSFGALLYEMATGRVAFSGATPAAVLEALLRAEPGGTLPAGLDPIVGRLLQRDPDRRFRSAAEVGAALAALTRDHSGAPRATSIAVLPFASLGADPENGYFADGMAEEIIGALSKVQALRVASRTSSFAFRDKRADVREIARALDVSTVLEGSVRRSGRKLRVAVQLVTAEDGFQLWSERYERDLEDVFAVQDEIAQSVAAALRVVLSPRERHALQRVPTPSIEAYDLYLRGRAALRSLTAEHIVHAQYLFRRATELDPAFTPAWLGLAEAAMWAYQWFDRSDKHLATAVEASARARAGAPDMAEAQLAYGIAAWLRDDDASAIASFERAQRIDPKLADAAFFLGRVHVTRGDFEQAVECFQRAATLAPDDFQPLALLTALLRGMNRPAEAMEAARSCVAVVERHLALHPDDARAYYLGSGCLSQLGAREAALEWAERALELAPRDGGVLYNVACTYIYEGMIERALELLERAVDQGWGNHAWLSNDPDMDAVRDHPRFQAMLARIGGQPS